MLPTSWPPVWPGGHNPFTPALGKYFLPDSTEHTEQGGTDWLWISAAESDTVWETNWTWGELRETTDWLVGYCVPGGGGKKGKSGLYMSIILKGKVSIRVQTALIKSPWPEGELDHCSGLWLWHTTHVHMGGSGGRQLGRDEDCWGGHLRLFKQISEEYQSLKTLRGILLVCSPAAEAFVSPWETILSSVKKVERGGLLNARRGKVPALVLPA